MDKIRINLFGIGCRIIKGQFDEATWEKFRQQADRIVIPLNEAFFDASLYEDGKFEGIKSWQDLGNVLQLAGLTDSYQSLIEIRINNRQRRKIKFQELYNEYVLFPLWQTSFLNSESREQQAGGVIIIEKEIGKIASFEFNTRRFLLDNLHFTLNKVALGEDAEYTILSQLRYNDKKLMLKKADTLVTERLAYLY